MFNKNNKLILQFLVILTVVTAYEEDCGNGQYCGGDLECCSSGCCYYFYKAWWFIAVILISVSTIIAIIVCFVIKRRRTQQQNNRFILNQQALLAQQQQQLNLRPSEPIQGFPILPSNHPFQNNQYIQGQQYPQNYNQINQNQAYYQSPLNNYPPKQNNVQNNVAYY